MTINLAGYTFEGPFKMPHESDLSLMHQSGVYVIHGNNGDNIWHVIYVGESENVSERVANHDRKDCWQRVQREKGCNTLGVSVLYLNENDRMIVEAKIIEHHNPPCNKR